MARENTPNQRMSRTRYLLQGRFTGGPIHPTLVHAPLTLLPVAVGFDIASFVSAQNLYVRSAYVILIIGVSLALLAALFGVIDYFYEVRGNKEREPILYLHAGGMVTAVLLGVISIILRAPELGAATTPVAPFALLIAATLVMYGASIFGGHMVFSQGTRIRPLERLAGLPEKPGEQAEEKDNVRRIRRIG